MTATEVLASIEHERRLLGAALRSTEARETLQQLVLDDFYVVQHKAVFSVIRERDASGGSMDPLLVRDDLRNSDPKYDVSDPEGLLVALHQSAGAASAAQEYVDVIKTYASARRLAESADRLGSLARTTEGSPSAVEEALLWAGEEIHSITDKAVKTEWEKIGDLASSVLDGDNASLDPIFATGFERLDTILNGGLRAGQMVVCAARPGMGKTTLALDISRNASLHQGVPGLFISLEMGGEEIASRLMSAEGKVDLGNITRNALREDDLAILDGVVERIEGAPLYVVDNAEPTLPSIVSLISTASRRIGIKYVVIDYGQLITSDGSGASDNREQMVANISRTLKGLARNLGIAVLFVSQLNRSAEQRHDNRPSVSDMRESGQIEQDADIILLIYRPDEYDPESVRQGEADVIVGKHRNGPTGVATLVFQGHYSRFGNIALQEEYA